MREPSGIQPEEYAAERRQVAAMAPESVSAVKRSGGVVHSAAGADPTGWLAETFFPTHATTLRDLELGPGRPWRDGVRWVLGICPWNPEHDDSAAYLVQFADGRVGAGCHHDGCAGKKWLEFRAAIEAKTHARTVAMAKAVLAGFPSGGSEAELDAYVEALTEQQIGALESLYEKDPGLVNAALDALQQEEGVDV